MKKIILILTLLFTITVSAQKQFVDYVAYAKYTTAEKNNIDVSDTAYVYVIFDSTLNRFQKNAGSGWQDYYSSGGGGGINFRPVVLVNFNKFLLSKHPSNNTSAGIGVIEPGDIIHDGWWGDDEYWYKAKFIGTDKNNKTDWQILDAIHYIPGV